MLTLQGEKQVLASSPEQHHILTSLCRGANTNRRHYCCGLALLVFACFCSITTTTTTITMAFTTTLSTARRAVRFFGTVHAQVDALQHRVQAVRQSGALLITPDRFPAVLATSCVTGLIVGWQIMDRIYNAAVRTLGVVLCRPVGFGKKKKRASFVGWDAHVGRPCLTFLVDKNCFLCRHNIGTRTLGKVRTR